MITHLATFCNKYGSSSEKTAANRYPAAQSVTNKAVGLSGNISPASACPTAAYRVSISYQIRKKNLIVFVKLF